MMNSYSLILLVGCSVTHQMEAKITQVKVAHLLQLGNGFLVLPLLLGQLLDGLATELKQCLCHVLALLGQQLSQSSQLTAQLPSLCEGQVGHGAKNPSNPLLLSSYSSKVLLHKLKHSVGATNTLLYFTRNYSQDWLLQQC